MVGNLYRQMQGWKGNLETEPMLEKHAQSFGCVRTHADKPRRHRGKKSRVIPSDLSMLWSHSTEIFQERQVSLPQAELTPRVNWDKVNQGAMKRFPKPSWQPIFSVSPSPSFYEKSCKCPAIIVKYHRDGEVRQPYVCGCPTQFTLQNPFGVLPGYITNLGVVPVPDSPVHGYIWDQASYDWILHAEFSTSGSAYSPAIPPGRQFWEPGTRGETERKEETAREEMTETERWEETKGCTTMDRSVRASVYARTSLSTLCLHWTGSTTAQPALVALNVSFRCTIYIHSMSPRCFIHTTSCVSSPPPCQARASC